MTVKYTCPSRQDLPESLMALAINMRWVWDDKLIEMFKSFDPVLWEEYRHNPVALLMNLDAAKAEELSADKDLYDQLQKKFKPEFKTPTTAYFSMEYGIHECLPVYSGGLGILSGDHMKAASDLALPMVGVGLAYREGYFQQQLDQHGNQTEYNRRNIFTQMPMSLAVDDSGLPVLIKIPFPEAEVLALVWRVDVGNVPLYLLDCDHDKNQEQYRQITRSLYGGDHTMRIQQEIVLGVGGQIMLEQFGINPEAYHLNEGHAAFQTLYRLSSLMSDGKSQSEAEAIVTDSTVFTTHTPVAAGNDMFNLDLARPYLKTLTGTDVEDLLKLGIMGEDNRFGMPVAALRLSRFANGVSEKHGEVSREMWSELWPEKQAPITHVTNGVHMPTWIAPSINPELSNLELWNNHCKLRRKLVSFAQEKFAFQMKRSGVEDVPNILDPDVLTIGFARRFAPYKRATLLFSDMKRLFAILSQSEKPVQVVMAGKAHPLNVEGKDLIREVWSHMQGELKGRLVLLENYNIEVGRHLVQGVDVWLNTPTRPVEASGTSGMKAAANGGLNLSVPDGWWLEGFNGVNGWEIGRRDIVDPQQQFIEDAESLYSLLESEVVPMFYDRNSDGLPEKWVEWMRNAIRSAHPRFSASRMVDEYNRRAYLK